MAWVWSKHEPLGEVDEPGVICITEYGPSCKQLFVVTNQCGVSRVRKNSILHVIYIVTITIIMILNVQKAMCSSFQDSCSSMMLEYICKAGVQV